jgi:DNA-binding IclR family transcriptional regulator
MRQLKLVGRELSVVRAIEHQGSVGQYLHERTGIDVPDLHDILAAMIELGYVEAYLPGHNLPTMEPVPVEQVLASRFEINPSYYLEIKKMLLRR